jgi:putative addiction module component (TIGR02574 family)
VRFAYDPETDDVALGQPSWYLYRDLKQRNDGFRGVSGGRWDQCQQPSEGQAVASTLESLGIDRLSMEERIVLVQQIWDSIAADPAAVPLTDAQRQELERRVAADDANPDDVVSWERVKADALARWAR